jgi:hypothetical protein
LVIIIIFYKGKKIKNYPPAFLEVDMYIN